jgi:hypothetical protein
MEVEGLSAGTLQRLPDQGIMRITAFADFMAQRLQ